MSKLRILVSETFDPWFNLATEDWIFRDMDPETHVLYLWRNSDTVVIGRFQNPWTECNTEKMEQDSIKLARRQSGGGAVYHDLGNTNFTFMSSKQNYDKSVNNKIIISALEQFGIKAYASGRNDILVDDHEGAKKISGSAFKETKDRSFHHGTLLINADLTKLGQYLNPSKKKLESKGIKSVRARVANLTQYNSELNHDELCKAIIKEFSDHYNEKCEVEILNNDYLKSVAKLNSYYETLKDWKWRFGETPKFTHTLEERFSWGGMEVHLDSHKGIITDCVIYSDSLHPEMIELLTASLCQISYSVDAVKSAVDNVKKQLPMIIEELDEFCSWLVKQIA
ncbi:lipoate--protein ligase [Halobacteriovorax sp. HLS]|uniref:lipoate--protein ligase n=1 Tax=Halobacteriovorax sp. HLS TaxID=2234000 RepID=UPI000FDC809F|nr:lipoate--protein ligase [Halobacteriovorax sp. HLS]